MAGSVDVAWSDRVLSRSTGSTDSAREFDHSRSWSEMSCIGVDPQVLAKAFQPSRSVGSHSGQRQPERFGGLRRAPVTGLDEPDHLALSAWELLHRDDESWLDVSHLAGRRGREQALFPSARSREADSKQVRNRVIHPGDPVPVLPRELQGRADGFANAIRGHPAAVGAS